MQNSTKRLLSMLVVLALVLTCAPGGILAVETRADEIEYGSTNWVAAKADKGANIQSNFNTQNAKQETVTDELDKLDPIDENTDLVARLTTLNGISVLTARCPFCEDVSVQWETLPNNGTADTTVVEGTKHYVVSGTYTNTAEHAIEMGSAEQAQDNKLCLLMDTATFDLDGILVYSVNEATVNIGGYGTITSDMSAIPSTTNNVGMLYVGGTKDIGGTTLNLYGGTMTTNNNGMHRGVMYGASSLATVNIWHNDVVIGPSNHLTPAEVTATTSRMNIRMYLGTLNMYAGTIKNGRSQFRWQGWNVYLDSGKLYMYGGTIEGGSGVGTVDLRGANLLMNGAAARAYIYGGTIQGGMVGSTSARLGGNIFVTDSAQLEVKGGSILGGLTSGENAGYGGNIYALRRAVVKISGTALISGGRAALVGGNIYLATGRAKSGDTAAADGASLEMTGGKITGGVCTSAKTTTYGGNIYLGGVSGYAADATISGGIVEGGLTTGNNATWGGNIHISKYCTVGVSNTAVITGGRAASCGGNITASGELNVTGGEITKGICNYTGNDTTLGGGNVFIPTDGKFEISSGTISGGYTTGTNAKHGGNILQRTGGTLTISNTAVIKEGRAAYGGNILTHDDDLSISAGTIKDGYATVNGGNFWVGGTATLTLDGIFVSGGTGAYNGGNIFANGTVNLKDVTIENGKSPKGGNIQIYSGKLTMTDDTVVSGGKGITSYASYGGNIYMINAKDGSTLKGTIKDGTGLNGGNVYIAGGTAAPAEGTAVPTITISADFAGATGKYGANMYVATRAIDGTSFIYARNLVFEGGTMTEGTLKDLNGIGGEPVYSDIYVGAPAAAAGDKPAGEGMKLTFKGEFDPVNISFTEGEGQNTLTFDSTWSKDVDLYTSNPYYINDTLSGDITAPNGLHETAKVKNLNGDKLNLERLDSGLLKVSYPDYAITNAEGTTTYTSAEDAVTAYTEGDLLVVASGKSIDIGEKAVTLDVIGTGNVVVTGSGTVSGIDRHNINFDNNTGSITADGVTVAKEVTAGGRRYIALSDATVDANKYTFHRVETKLTNVTVNVANAGIYYKAEYQFDEIVKARVASYGVNVNLEGAKGDQTSSSDMGAYDAENHTLTASSHGVYGVFKPDKASNMEDGQIKLCGNPYLAINTTGNMEASDCPMFTADKSVNMSMADAMEMANEKWDRLTEEGKTNLKQFFEKWLEEGAWDAQWAAELTNLYPTEA